MSVIVEVTREAAKKDLPFLLIGGYAVMAYGFVRTTGDIDFLIRKSQATDWQKLLEGLKYTVKFSSPNFLQFNSRPGENLPVDLMFVTDENFSQMFSEGGFKWLAQGGWAGGRCHLGFGRQGIFWGAS